MRAVTECAGCLKEFEIQPTIDPAGNKVFDFVEFCPDCSAKLDELEDQMGYNDPAYLAHLEEERKEHEGSR